MIDDRAAHRFAVELRDAELDGSSADRPSTRFASFDWGDARRIACERDALRRAEGDEQIGYKLGWTSAAMREALGVERPNWGTLWNSQQLDGPLALNLLRHPKAEPEVVFVAGTALLGDAVSADEVLATAAGWAIGIEVVHPRFESYDFTWLDNTADNSSAAAVAVGPVGESVADPSAVEVRLSDGFDERTGLGEQAMGSPAAAVAWLARQLHGEGRGLRTGDIVFTGGLTAPFDVDRRSRLTARCPELGIVEITTTDSTTTDSAEGNRPWPE